MCGIYGVAGACGPDEPRRVRRMGEVQHHRGPDDCGQADGPLGIMGMCRLAIVDVDGGRQPISNETRDVHVVFNGEIYNFAALRDELRAAGHTFATRSDTEAIVHGYEEWGDDVVHRLSGMFAFAIFDERRRRVLFARDHLGKKPLYFWDRGTSVVFSSELKGITTRDDFTKEIEPQALWQYFTLKNVPAPLSAFRGVTQLPQGSLAVWDAEGLRIRPYFRPRFTGESGIDEAEAAEELLRLMREAVARRMLVSDVPVGAYLSGGLDSSLIVALASEIMDRPLDTFSLGYAQPVSHKTDLGYAQAVARRFGTNHRELLLEIGDVIEALPAIVDAFDEPFGAGTSPYYLAGLISKHVKVALTGDGADEIFGSYAAHRAAAAIQAVRSGTDPAGFTSFYGGLDFITQCAGEPDELWRTRFAAFTDSEKRELVAGGGRFANSSEYFAPFFSEAQGDLVNRVLEVECRTVLPDQILTYVDRLSMAHSVETRSPFLDRTIVDYASHLPGSLKVRGSQTKAVLKRAARSVLPAEIVDRPKEGFILPFDRWLAHDLAPLVREVTSPAWLEHGLLNARAVNRYVDQHLSGSKNHTYKVWTLLMFQMWHARAIEGKDLHEIVQPAAVPTTV